MCGGMQDNDVVVRAERRAQPARHHQRGMEAPADWRRHRRSSPIPTTRASSTARRRTGSIERANRVTGESKSIRPSPGPGEPPLRWNWDSPLTFSAVRPCAPGWRAARVPVDRPRRLLDRDQSRSDERRRPRRAHDHGREGRRRPHLAQRRHQRLADDRHGRRVGQTGRPLLHGDRRRRGERVEGRRKDVGQDAGRPHVRIPQGRLGLGGRALALRRGHGVRVGRRAPAQ